MPKGNSLQEKTTFKVDPEELETDEEKNERLSDLLLGPWLGLAIVVIQRIEIGSQKGWKATYRE
jgi:hypothetical protein